MTPERNDPTRAGFTPPGTASARLSCSEVEALCQKAARGAGLDWGLAEEAGFAARWLYSRGLDGPGALLAYLDRANADVPGLVLEGTRFRAGGQGSLCPVALGAALSDFAATGLDHLRAGPVHRPLLVLPFVHQIACASGGQAVLGWDGQQVSVSAAGDIAGDLAALAELDAAEIAVAPAAGMPGQAAPQGAPAAPATETLARLDGFAMRTTVPASAASRADAGSADGDND